MTWAARRPLAYDTLVHQFVRELLAQRTARPYGPDSLTTFYLGTTLFEQAPDQHSARCPTCNSPNLSGHLLVHLVAQHALTPADTVFMRQQLRGAAEVRLTPGLLPGYEVVPLDTLWALDRRLGRRRRLEAARILEERYHTADFFWISVPLFPRDRQTVIVDISYDCGGLCGAGTSYVLRRQNNRWRIMQQMQRWVS
ncbi:hypothetical protein LGH70_00650 [Hymenobacter sp. BT635]|uniref:Uncharacterized protein n=1 Tax=Hymenobacter nitidus TaxID=2880929 RepID=A0ABS8A849_9BACT|nr:hypothetical protein [Hymenobacter nitidus]MCB2376072.1 hypothetical protein [Hymenobacter nitidus]